MLILARVVHIDDIIVAISVFLNQWFLHLMWNIVLPVLGGWLEASRMHWVNLGHRWLGSIFLIQSLISSLNIFTKRMLIFIRIVNINDIIVAISVFLNQWFLHLMRNIVLPIFGGWLETSWMNRIYL
jgi:hypothetical protein